MRVELEADVDIALHEPGRIERTLDRPAIPVVRRVAVLQRYGADRDGLRRGRCGMCRRCAEPERNDADTHPNGGRSRRRQAGRHHEIPAERLLLWQTFTHAPPYGVNRVAYRLRSLSRIFRGRRLIGLEEAGAPVVI